MPRALTRVYVPLPAAAARVRSHENELGEPCSRRYA